MLYQDTVAKVLTEYENIFPLPEHIPLKCELYSSLIVKSAEITMGTRPSTKKSKNNLKNKPSPTLHKLWQKLKKLFEKWKFKGKCRDPDDSLFNSYREARGIFQRRYRYEMR